MAEPPLGEDHFTAVLRRDILNLPVGVKPDIRPSNEFRKTPHVLQFKSAKGKTPTSSHSCIFSRAERGMKISSVKYRDYCVNTFVSASDAEAEIHRDISYFMARRIGVHRDVVRAYHEAVEEY